MKFPFEFLFLGSFHVAFLPISHSCSAVVHLLNCWEKYAGEVNFLSSCMSEHVLSSYLIYNLVEYRTLDLCILFPEDFDGIATWWSRFHVPYMNCIIILPDLCVRSVFFSPSPSHPSVWKLLLSSSLGFWNYIDPFFIPCPWKSGILLFWRFKFHQFLNIFLFFFVGNFFFIIFLVSFLVFLLDIGCSRLVLQFSYLFSSTFHFFLGNLTNLIFQGFLFCFCFTYPPIIYFYF